MKSPFIVPHLIDCFSDPHPSGKVIGTSVPGAGDPDGKDRADTPVTRKGVDREGVIGIDHDALRIQPLIQPGWNRAALVYGPFQRENGLMLAVNVLNGHNASQTGGLTQKFSSRVKNWLYASGIDPLPTRLVRLLGYPRKKRVLRQIRRWSTTNQTYHLQQIKENLALGWYSSEMPAQPAADGSSFVVHSHINNNANLWVRQGEHNQIAINGLQNIPYSYIVILRQHGAAYYAASLPGANGLPALPEMRPLAINPIGEETAVYAGLHQSVLGEIGFHVDTRVYGVQIEQASEYAHWYGSAHAADNLNRGFGKLAPEAQTGDPAEIGGLWQLLTGESLQDPSLEHQAIALLDPGAPSGLIHVLLNNAGGLVWRFQDVENYWRVRLTDLGAYLESVEQGQSRSIATISGQFFSAGHDISLQILDDGVDFHVTLNGQLLFEPGLQDQRMGQASGVGLIYDPRLGQAAHHFEAHPRVVPLPACCRLPFPKLPFPASLSQSGPVQVQDNFVGSPGDLHGRSSAPEAGIWRREIGSGVFDINADGCANVRASRLAPNPGRTAYTIPWQQPEIADIQLDVVPPGSQRGQGEASRAGLIFWQDPKNYIIISTWLDDCYFSASISSFFYLGGFEDVYDAVWTNIGERVTWGRAYRLRAAFDGLRYQVWLNNEPVLYRSLTDVYPDACRLAIQRVGIAANWEWGNDTGSTFRYFEARSMGASNTSSLNPLIGTAQLQDEGKTIYVPTNFIPAS